MAGQHDALAGAELQGHRRVRGGGVEAQQSVVHPRLAEDQRVGLGVEVDGPAGFREYLLSRSDEFLRTVTEKLLAYALGRELRYYDAPTVRQIVRDAGGEEALWTPVILGIVKSIPFQMRRGEGESKA